MSPAIIQQHQETLQKMYERHGEARTTHFTMMVQMLGTTLTGLWAPPIQYPGLRQTIGERFGLTGARLNEISSIDGPLEVTYFLNYCSRQAYVVILLGDLLFDTPVGAGWRRELFDNSPDGEKWRGHTDALRQLGRLLLKAWESYEPTPSVETDEAVPSSDGNAGPEENPGEEEEEELLDPNEDETVPAGSELRKLRTELEALVFRELQTGATWQPDRRGPFLRRNYSDLELAALRLLLTYVPDLGQLLPDYPLTLAMQSLSGFQPAPRLADMRQRFRDLKPNQPIHLSIHDAVLLLQIIHGGALLLLPTTRDHLTRQLRRQLERGPDLDDATREQCSRLLLLLTDADTHARFRKTFGPLTQSFAKAVDQTFPHHLSITQARAEVAELATLR